MYMLKIHPGMHVRLLETVDNALGAKKRVASTVVGSKLGKCGSKEDEITIMVIVKDGMHNICTTKRKECVMSHRDSKMYWKKSFPLKHWSYRAIKL